MVKLRKVFMFALAVIMVCSLAACGEKITAPTVASATTNIDLASVSDTSVTFDIGNGKFEKIKKGETDVAAANYTLKDNSIVTFKSSYLVSLGIAKHTLTLVTNGGSVNFDLVISDSRAENPSITNSGLAFDKAAEADVVLDINWGRGSFSSLELIVDATAEKLVKDEDFTISGNNITIVSSYLKVLPLGENSFKLSSSSGSVAFKINIKKSSVTINGDAQKAFVSGDLQFDISFNNNELKDIKLLNEVIASSSYVVTDNGVTFKESYLSTLNDGIHTFTLTDSLDKVNTLVVTKGGIFAESFQNGNIESSNFTYSSIPVSVKNIENAIDGRSLELTAQNGLAWTLCQGKNFNLETTKLYEFSIDFKKNDDIQLIFALGNINAAWIKADGTLSQEAGQIADKRTTLTKNGDIYTLKMIVSPLAANEQFKVMYINDMDGNTTPSVVVIDNIFIKESALNFKEAQKPVLVPTTVIFDKTKDKDIEINIQNNYASFRSITNGSNTLVKDTDYTLTQTKLVIKAAYIKGLNLETGNTLTLKYNSFDKDNDSRKFANDLTFTISEGATVWGEVTVKDYNGASDVTFDVNFEENDIKSIYTDGILVASSGNYEHSKTTLTINKAYLDTLEARPYEFVLTDSKDIKFSFTINVNVTKEDISYHNFNDGQLINGQNLGIAMQSSIEENGINDKSAKLVGNGTLLFFNRDGHPNLDYSFNVGDTYEFSMKFKLNEKLLESDGGDWSVIDGTLKKNVLFAFISGMQNEIKRAYITGTTENELALVKLNNCISDKTSLVKNGDIYTVKVTFVADNNRAFSVPVWMNADVIIDDVLIRPVVGAPTVSANSTYVGKNNADGLTIGLGLHNGDITKIENGADVIDPANYTYANGKLNIKKAYIDTLENNSTAMIKITTSGGEVSVSVKVYEIAPIFDSAVTKNFTKESENVVFSLDVGTLSIKEIKIGDNVVATENYTFDAGAKTLTFGKQYILTIPGSTNFTLSFNGIDLTLNFAIVSSVLYAEDFEGAETILTKFPTAFASKWDGVWGTKGTVNDNGFDGKGADFLNSAGEYLFLIGGEFNTLASFTKDKTYAVTFDFKLLNPLTLSERAIFVPIGFGNQTSHIATLWAETDGTISISNAGANNEECSIVKNGDIYTVVFTFKLVESYNHLELPLILSGTSIQVDNLFIETK